MPDLDDRADFELHAPHLCKGRLTRLASQHLLIVVFVILRTSLAILYLVLDHRDEDDEAERQHREEGTVRLPDTRHYLQQDQEDEVGIDYFEQLKEQIFGHEVALRVAGCRDQVIRKATVRLFWRKARVKLEDTPC